MSAEQEAYAREIAPTAASSTAHISVDGMHMLLSGAREELRCILGARTSLSLVLAELDTERAAHAETARERVEARETVCSLAVWGHKRPELWRESASEIHSKLVEDARQIVDLMHARDAAERQAAALAAEVAELREALGNVMEWYEGSEPGHFDGHGPGVVRCAYCEAKSALSRSPGSQDALRAMLDRCVSDCLAGMNETGIFPDAHKIVTRILSGGAA